jgi:protein involved in polysaccharide export with SLBB domain
VLGLIDDDAVFDEESAQGPDIPAEMAPKPIPLPPVGGEASDLQPDEGTLDLDKLTPEQREAIRELLRLRSQKRTRPSGLPARAPRRTVRQVARQVPTSPHPSPVIVVPTERGKVKVTIEVEGNVKGPASSSTPLPEQEDDPWGVGMTRIRHPRDSDRVFVDLAAYNHTVYYVQGDAAAPGRLPITGNETVLDALNHAGGLATTADPANIKLIRPGHGGEPSRIYHINYKAIMEEGDAKSNLQIFPGDRLVIGRHPTVQATVALDRVTAFVNSATNTILTDSYMAKNLRTGTQEAPLTPEQIRERVDAWLDVMWPLIEKGEAGVVDKETFREALLKPVAPETKPKGGSKDE